MSFQFKIFSTSADDVKVKDKYHFKDSDVSAGPSDKSDSPDSFDETYKNPVRVPK